MFHYTADELGHLLALQEMCFMHRLDGSYWDADYWRHCATFCDGLHDAPSADDCFERADALDCGMEGETL
jgi:hypothetical protein